METAPFYADMADGPEGGQAWWLTARDGVRVRVALWNGEAQKGTGKGTGKGTVLLFPGRTEYIEKYGRAAGDLAKCGYATLTIDWRGQGLADRLLDDSMMGHVQHFTDYQLDVAAMLAAAQDLDLPKPWHLLAHSMGGCIGLRSLYDGLPVQTVTFSAPMWGIGISKPMRPFGWALSWGSRFVGMGYRLSPGTSPASYVLTEPFESNKLTPDRDMYQYMIDQTRAQPGFGLGGPSLRWLYEALTETRALSKRPSPDIACLTFMGSDEDIVDTPRITGRMARWPGSRFEIIEGGRHEMLMDSVETRKTVFGMICRFMCDNGGGLRDRAPPAGADGQAG